MYGHLTPADSPMFEHSNNQFLATQFYQNNAGSFFNENWFGCTSTNTKNPQYAAPYQLYFALSAGSNCPTDSVWIEIVATPVSAVSAYAYTA